MRLATDKIIKYSNSQTKESLFIEENSTLIWSCQLIIPCTLRDANGYRKPWKCSAHHSRRFFCQLLLPKSVSETTWTSSNGWRKVTITKSYFLTQGGQDRTVYIMFIMWLLHMALLGTFNYVYMIRSVTSLPFTLVRRKCTTYEQPCCGLCSPRQTHHPWDSVIILCVLRFAGIVFCD